MLTVYAFLLCSILQAWAEKTWINIQRHNQGLFFPPYLEKRVNRTYVKSVDCPFITVILHAYSNNIFPQCCSTMNIQSTNHKFLSSSNKGWSLHYIVKCIIKWKVKITWWSAYLYPIFTWIHHVRLFGSSLLRANVSVSCSCVRLRPWSVLAVVLFLLVGAGLGHDWAMQVQFTAQGGVELLAAPQLLLQSAVLPLQAQQSAGTRQTFLLNSSCKRDSCSRPIRELSLA